MIEEREEAVEEGAEPIPYPKADLVDRFLAKFIDFLVAGALFVFPSFVGPLAGVTYILICDGLRGGGAGRGGGSFGKRIVGLRVVSLVREGRSCDFKESIIRNSVFAAFVAAYILLGWIPYIGKLLAFLAGMAIVATEMALVYSDDKGIRFGDSIADTMVVGPEGEGEGEPEATP
ncbi:MAG: RDD family protein [Thermodesulfobacteriota bacterium]